MQKNAGPIENRPPATQGTLRAELASASDRKFGAPSKSYTPAQAVAKTGLTDHRIRGRCRCGEWPKSKFLRILADYDARSPDGREANTGFREWTRHSYNIACGCVHDCKYCVQRRCGVRHGDVPSPQAWSNERLKDVMPKIRFFPGGVMFPSSHDITPPFVAAAIVALKALLSVGNDVLIVSKPHIECIRQICAALKGYESKVLFRFTISTLDRKLAEFWEPGAPAPRERLMCLQYVKREGFRTSVSMEPTLLGTEETVRTFHRLLPWVSETIWIGKMNLKAVFGDKSVRVVYKYVRALQSDDYILELVSRLGDHPKVRWKDSIRRVIRSHVSLRQDWRRHPAQPWPAGRGYPSTWRIVIPVVIKVPLFRCWNSEDK